MRKWQRWCCFLEPNVKVSHSAVEAATKLGTDSTREETPTQLNKMFCTDTKSKEPVLRSLSPGTLRACPAGSLLPLACHGQGRLGTSPPSSPKGRSGILSKKLKKERKKEQRTKNKEKKRKKEKNKKRKSKKKEKNTDKKKGKTPKKQPPQGKLKHLCRTPKPSLTDVFWYLKDKNCATHPKGTAECFSMVTGVLRCLTKSDFFGQGFDFVVFL